MAAHGPWAACRRPADFVDRRMDSKDLQPFASCGGQKFGPAEKLEFRDGTDGTDGKPMGH